MDTVTVAVIETVVDLIGEVVTDVTGNAAAQKAVTAIETWTPIIAQKAPQYLAQVEDFIDTLTGSDVLTDDQIAQLDTSRQTLEARRAAIKAARTGSAS